MSEPKERKERDWEDAEADPEEGPEPYEETYRDGSAKNECWDSDR